MIIEAPRSVRELRTESKPRWWEKYVRLSAGGEGPLESVRTVCRALPKEPGMRLLDIGCGSGIVGIYALIKRRAEYVTFVDYSWDCIQEVTSNVAGHTAQARFDRTQVSYYVGRYQNLEARQVREFDHVVFRLSDCSSVDEPAQVREFLDWHARLLPLLGRQKPRILMHLPVFPGLRELLSEFQKSGLGLVVRGGSEVPGVFPVTELGPQEWGGTALTVEIVAASW